MSFPKRKSPIQAGTRRSQVERFGRRSGSRSTAAAISVRAGSPGRASAVRAHANSNTARSPTFRSVGWPASLSTSFPSFPCGCGLLALYPVGDVRYDLHYSPRSGPGAIEFPVYPPRNGTDIFLVTKVDSQIFPYSSIHSLKNFLLSLDERGVIRRLFWRRPLPHCVNR